MFTEELNTYLDFLHRLSIDSPHHLASRLLFATLHSDGVANLEIMLNTGEQRASDTDIAGASRLGKDTAICTHTPHP